MSNIIQSNPGIIDLREDNSTWSAPVNYEIPGYKDNENPAVLAREEYKNDLYINALHDDQESRAVETAQPPTPIREGGAQVNAYERVSAPGEVHQYATADGRSIDPAHAEAVLDAMANVTHAYSSPEQVAPEATYNSQEYIFAAAGRAGAYGDRIDSMRGRALLDWGAEGEN